MQFVLKPNFWTPTASQWHFFNKEGCGNCPEILHFYSIRPVITCTWPVLKSDFRFLSMKQECEGESAFFFSSWITADVFGPKCIFHSAYRVSSFERETQGNKSFSFSCCGRLFWLARLQTQRKNFTSKTNSCHLNFREKNVIRW